MSVLSGLRRTSFWKAVKLVAGAKTGVGDVLGGELLRLPPLFVEPWDRWLASGALAAAAVLAPSDLHDLVLGNVMALYVGAVAVSVARPGWLGSGFLGAVCAVALKPAIGPYLVWLAIRRPRDAVRTLAVGLAVSVVFAVLVGPGRYVEYLVALPRMSVLVGLPSGNVGLATISPAVALAGVAFAYVATVWAGLRLDLGRGAAIAVAACLLAQPSIGFNYAGLLIPAVVALWSADHAAGFVAVLAAPIVAVVSPPVASLVVIALAAVRLGERLGLDRDEDATAAPAQPPVTLPSVRPG
jgi:hypothetical protein